MGSSQVIALALATSMGVFLLLTGLFSMVHRDRESASRLETYLAPRTITKPEQESLPGRGVLIAMDKMLAQRKFGGALALKLAQADLRLTVAEYVLLHGALFAGGLLVGPFLLSSPVGGILLAVGLLLVPSFYVGHAQSKRIQAFNEQLPAALNSLSNSLRGGYGLVQAMVLVATESPSPMSAEFQRVVSEVSYGLPYDVAFKNMLRRNPGPDLTMVVTAIEINLEVGGNLSEILDNISAIIRDRVRIQGQVRAYTAQTRLSSYVLMFLPFGLAGVMFVVNRPYIAQLWTTTVGLVMLGVASFMWLMGSMVLSKLGKIEA